MANKPTKSINHAPAGTMSEQEKRARTMQFLVAKREQYALNILTGLCTNPKTLEEKVVVNSVGQHTEISNAEKVVNLSVKMADLLLEKLYPIKEESK